MKFLFDTSKVIKKIEDMNEVLERMREKYQSEAQGLFNELTGGFFRAYPEVKCIYWTQYTPHFNDGEDCVFEVNEIYYALNRDYDGSKFTSLDSAASEWDQVDENEDEEYEDIDDEGDMFSNRKVTDIQEEISRYQALLDNPNPNSLTYNYRTNGQAFVGERTRGYGDYVYTFNPDSCRKHITRLEAELENVREELEQFPNRNEIVEAIEQVKTFIKSVDSDLMQDIFGDHVRVVLDKDGSHTYEYEHD